MCYHLSITVTKCSRLTTYKEERFLLECTFRGFSPWLAAFGPVARQTSMMAEAQWSCLACVRPI